MQSNLFDKKRSFTKHNYISKNFHHCDTKKKILFIVVYHSRYSKVYIIKFNMMDFDMVEFYMIEFSTGLLQLF